MDESRKQFEEWRRRTAKMDPDSSVALHGMDDDADYENRTTRAMWIGWQAARSLTERSRADVLEEAAKVCERLTSEYRDAYKGRIEPIDRSRLYNPHTEGLSDGAWECAEAIRALASSPSGKPGGEG